MLGYKIAAPDQVDFLNFLIRNINSLKLKCSVIAQKGRLLSFARLFNGWLLPKGPKAVTGVTELSSRPCISNQHFNFKSFACINTLGAWDIQQGAENLSSPPPAGDDSHRNCNITVI